MLITVWFALRGALTQISARDVLLVERWRRRLRVRENEPASQMLAVESSLARRLKENRKHLKEERKRRSCSMMHSWRQGHLPNENEPASQMLAVESLPQRKHKAPQRRKKEAKTLDDAQPETGAPAKRARKVLNKKEREDLSDYLKSVDDDVLQLLGDIVTHHRCKFVELYFECKKGVDSFLHFQLQWHHHCSAFLLSRKYPLATIKLNKAAEALVAGLRNQWLKFCGNNGLCESESNKVMIPISSAVYELLLERTEQFQRSLSPAASKSITASGSGKPVNLVDGDDVYFRFGGAALCDMLHQHCKPIHRKIPFLKR